MKLQAFAAAWNAEEFTSIDVGIPMNIPFPYVVSLYSWVPRAGGVAVTIGSGKFGTPWSRMHLVVSSARVICCSLAFVLGSPSGISSKHLACADLKVGESGLMRVPAKLMPPSPPSGSGKFVTPWARMHSAYFSASVSDLPEEFDGPEFVVVVVVEPVLATPGDPEPPQAAKSTTTAASASPTPAARNFFV